MNDDGHPGSPIGQLFEKTREAQGLERPEAQARLGWGGARPGDKVNHIERIVRMPKLDRALAYALMLGLTVEDMARAVGVELPPAAPEDPKTSLVMEHVLRATGWEPSFVAAALQTNIDEVSGWIDGTKRMPSEAARRLLLFVPIQLQTLEDLNKQAETLRQKAAKEAAARDKRERRERDRRDGS